MHMRPRLAYLLLLAPLLATGAPTNPVKQTWLPRSPDHWHGTVASGVTLSLRDGAEKHVSGKVMDSVLAVKAKLEAVSGQSAELALVDTEQPNAYATVQKGRSIIALSLSYLDRFGSDRDALAATIGHELAHLELGHGAAARHADGLALDGGSASPGAPEFDAIARAQERQADDLGMSWATAAGYDPCGQARIFRALSSDIPRLSTHPRFAERLKAADAASMKTRGRNCE